MEEHEMEKLPGEIEKAAKGLHRQRLRGAAPGTNDLVERLESATEQLTRQEQYGFRV